MHQLINPNNSCSFSGYRPEKLPWGTDENSHRCATLLNNLSLTLRKVFDSGVQHFICGMARGCDTYFCEAVISLRESFPTISLEAAVPFNKQAQAWSEFERERYEGLLSRCDTVTFVSEDYSRSCMMKRNRYMVNNSSVLIAVFDGKPGGTSNTVNYAKKRGIEIILIEP